MRSAVGNGQVVAFRTAPESRKKTESKHAGVAPYRHTNSRTPQNKGILVVVAVPLSVSPVSPDSPDARDCSGESPRRRGAQRVFLHRAAEGVRSQRQRDQRGDWRQGEMSYGGERGGGTIQTLQERRKEGRTRDSMDDGPADLARKNRKNAQRRRRGETKKLQRLLEGSGGEAGHRPGGPRSPLPPPLRWRKEKSELEMFSTPNPPSSPPPPELPLTDR
jgi:hypothetical protein